MSVSAIGSSTTASLSRADAQSSASTSPANDGSTNGSGGASTASGSAAASSTPVTLSPTAQALATLAAGGYTLTMTDANGKPVSASVLNGVNLPAMSAGESMSAYASQVFGALTSALQSSGLNIGLTQANGFSISEVRDPGLKIPTNPAEWQTFAQETATAIKNANLGTPSSDDQENGVVSQSSFESAVAQYGGTKSEADGIFAALDGSQNGLLSNSDFLNDMSNLSNDAKGSSGQTLLNLLASAGGNTVSAGALLGFESAVEGAEKPASGS
jgi:hypothetical protein